MNNCVHRALQKKEERKKEAHAQYTIALMASKIEQSQQLQQLRKVYLYML